MKYVLLAAALTSLTSSFAFASRQTDNSSQCLVNVNSYRCQYASTAKDLKDEVAAEKASEDNKEEKKVEEK